MKRKHTAHLYKICFCLCIFCLLLLAAAVVFQEENPRDREPKDTAQEEKPQRKRHKEPIMDTIVSIEPEKTLSIADVQAMEAGSVLDITDMDPGEMEQLFSSSELSEEVRQRIWNCSYRENDTIGLEDLRYLRVLHMGFDGETRIGELIVNQSIAEDILEIMSELYRQKYPIEKMVLVDAYGADDEASMSDNNTSAFNYREIAGSSRLSKHGMGLAIDINPRYNPCVKKNKSKGTEVSPSNGASYADRSQEFSYKIDENDLCFQLFSNHGFTWGGDWNSLKDYQHFEK